MSSILYVAIGLIVLMSLIAVFAAIVILNDVSKYYGDYRLMLERIIVTRSVTDKQGTGEVAATVPVATADEEDKNGVSFFAEKRTLDEEYSDLSPMYKKYYDEIVRHAQSVEGNKRYKTVNYEEFKLGKNRLVKLKIKRGIVMCDLLIPNLAFKNYINENKVETRMQSSMVKLVNDEAVTAVKDCIDIAVREIEEERAIKKEQQNMRRKLKRQQAKLEQNKAAESAE